MGKGDPKRDDADGTEKPRPKHFSMIREFALADLITLANGASGMGAILLLMAYVAEPDVTERDARLDLDAPAVRGLRAIVVTGLEVQPRERGREALQVHEQLLLGGLGENAAQRTIGRGRDPGAARQTRFEVAARER